MMFVAPMPHDAYIDAVAHHLTCLGHEPAQWWTETPDGEQLDGVIILGGTANPDLWPGRVWLGWDQRTGWALCDDTRTLFPLDLGTYAAPEVVAVRARDQLMGRPDTIAGEDWNDADEYWDGAEALAEAVGKWENDD
jgi:hypothetical protein